jgi:hypothetical protein
LYLDAFRGQYRPTSSAQLVRETTNVFPEFGIIF